MTVKLIRIIVVMHSHAAVANRKGMIVARMMIVVMHSHSHAAVANRKRMIVARMRYVCFLFGMFYYLFSAMFFCTNSIFN